MIVALRALDGKALYTLAVGFYFIQQIFDAIFFWNYAAFFRKLMIAEKTGGQLLFERGIGQHITGNLPGEKLIIGQILIECMDILSWKTIDGFRHCNTGSCVMIIAGYLKLFRFTLLLCVGSMQ